jgi:hypothetical protein
MFDLMSGRVQCDVFAVMCDCCMRESDDTCTWLLQPASCYVNLHRRVCHCCCEFILLMQCRHQFCWFRACDLDVLQILLR